MRKQFNFKRFHLLGVWIRLVIIPDQVQAAMHNHVCPVCFTRFILRGGLTLHHFGYSENLAHAILLAVDYPGNTLGQIYNAADSEVLTLRTVVELIATALDHSAGAKCSRRPVASTRRA